MFKKTLGAGTKKKWAGSLKFVISQLIVIRWRFGKSMAELAYRRFVFTPFYL